MGKNEIVTFHNVGRATRSMGPTLIKGRGAAVYSADGRHFLDFTGAGGTLVVGHCHPDIVQAVKAQVEALIHTDYYLAAHPLYEQLARRLSQALGRQVQCAFFTSGSEAVENAAKLARHVTGKKGLVSFCDSWHGRGYLALSLTGSPACQKEGFGPLPGEVHQVSYPATAAAAGEVLDSVDALMAQTDIAAVFAEAVQGEGGVIPAPDGFLDGLKSLCTKHGALLVTDEILTGYWRTGAFTASQRLMREVPDIQVFGKSMGGGLPLSAVVCAGPLLDELPADSLGGTFPGNPVCCAAGLAVLEVTSDSQFIRRVDEVARQLWEAWTDYAARWPGMIADVRGMGSMVGVQMRTTAMADRLRAGLLSQGILTSWVGARETVLRHMMPLVITDDELAIWRSACEVALAAMDGDSSSGSPGG